MTASEHKEFSQWEQGDEHLLFKQIMDLNPVGIVVLDEQGHITLMNREAKRVFRIQEGGVQGRSYDSPEWCITDLAGNPLASEQLPFSIVRRTAGPIHDYRHAIQCGDVRTLLSIDAVPLMTAEGTFTGMIATVTDITAKMKAEEALINSTSTLQSVLDAAPVGIGLVTDRVFNWTNPRLSEMTGYTARELIGKRATILYESIDEFERVGREKYDSIKSTGRGSVETRWKRKDGALIDIILSSTAIDKNDLSKGVVFTAQDITERKKIENELKKSEEHYRFIFDGAGDAIFGVDLESLKAILVNKRMCALTGYTHRELMTLHLRDIHPPEELEWILREFNTQLLAADKIAKEIPVRRKDGSLVYCDITAGLLTLEGRECVVGFFRDVSERIDAFRTVRDMADKYRTIIESIPIGMHLYELHDGNELVFIDANPAADRILGVDNRTFVGKSIGEAFPALVDTEVPERYLSVIRTGIPWHVNEFSYKEPTISGIFEVHAFRTDPGHMAAAFVDISDRKQMLDQLRSSLKEKEVLLRELHHRVKNNLQLIKSMINLQSHHITDRTMLSLFQETQDRVMSMALVHELLYHGETFASINAGHYLQKMLNHLIQANGQENPPTVSIRTDDFDLDVDQAITCGLIITELVTNALKYAFSDKGGELTLEFLTTSPDSYRICVRDNGIGLPPDIDLQSTKTLGLTLIRLLVEQMDGSCTIDRSAGTEFTIEFGKHRS